MGSGGKGDSGGGEDGKSGSSGLLLQNLRYGKAHAGL
ncbi:sporulation protein YjcZ [Bacillus mycoides]